MAHASGHEWMKSIRRLTSIKINYLKYSGLGEIDSSCSHILKCAYFVYKVWMLVTMCILAITVFADIYANMDNLSITTDDGCIFAGIFVVIFKAMNLQIHRGKMKKLLDDIFKCGDDLCEFSELESVREIIDKYYTRNKVMFYGFCVIGGCLGFALLCFTPMEDGLPIRAKYPLNTTISPWREISFFVETCAVSGGLLGIIVMDSMTTFKCSLITMLLDALNVNFENCHDETSTEQTIDVYTSDGDKKKGDENRFLDRYKRCLRFHQRLVIISKDYNKIYNLSMFVQMLSSTTIICLTGFQAVVVGGQSSNIMKYGIYLSAAMSQLFYICWLGNELDYASSTLDKSQWFSGWHHERLAGVARIFTLSTVFTRKSIILRASAFYVLSLETFIVVRRRDIPFTWIIKRSYSFFTLLNNMDLTDH